MTEHRVDFGYSPKVSLTSKKAKLPLQVEHQHVCTFGIISTDICLQKGSLPSIQNETAMQGPDELQLVHSGGAI